MNDLKRVRKSLGLTQDQMAAKLGYKSRRALSNVESGWFKMGDTTLAHLRTIEKYELRKPVIFDQPVRPVEVWMECLKFLNSSKSGESIPIRCARIEVKRVQDMARRSNWNCKIKTNGSEIICKKL